jgi:hypothetical protein
VDVLETALLVKKAGFDQRESAQLAPAQVCRPVAQNSTAQEQRLGCSSCTGRELCKSSFQLLCEVFKAGSICGLQ